MIYSNNSVRLPGGRALNDLSSSAELLDDSFMGQFENDNPNDRQFWQDLDHWNIQLQDEAFYLGEPPLYPQEPEGVVELSAYVQHNANSEQVSDVVYQLQTIQGPTHDMDNNIDIQHTQYLEQRDDVWDEARNPHDPKNRTYYDNGFNDNLQFPYSDQSLQQTAYWNENFRDPLYDIDFNPGFQLDDFEPSVNTQNQKQEHLDQVADLGTADNGIIYCPQEPQGRFINPSLIWNGQVPLDHVAPLGAEDVSLYQSRELLRGLVEPGLSWIDPAPKFEQAPYRLSPVPMDALAENRHQYGNNTVPPLPKRERRNGLPCRRRANMRNEDHSKFYQSLPKAPSSWKPYQHSTVIFSYNEYGNLYTNDRFSANHILEYLFYHPLHSDENRLYDPKNGGLTLWIQTVPADVAKRYPDGKSDKCRFADCPIQGGSIRKGFFRVAFDEHSKSGRSIDPYHCAGFVHLFCLEKFCDFPQIYQSLDVRPDQRQFEEETNKMAITRDHRELVNVIRAYTRSFAKPDPWDYEQTLSFQLTSKHLELQPKTRHSKRIERGGNHIGLHKGDLDKFVAGERLKRERRKERRQDAPKGGKRKRDPLDEEEGIANVENEVKEKDRPVKRRMRDFR